MNRNKIILSVSAFYLSIDRIEKEVKELDVAGIDSFHIDLMDGNFVSNLGMSLQDMDAIRKYTNKPLDVHMMVTDPGRYIDLVAEHGANIIYIHPEADMHPTATLSKIKERGIQTGIAINPGTSIHQIEELLFLTDYVLCMTVNPGFAGQSYLEWVETKLINLAQMQKKYNFLLMVDGGVTRDVMLRLRSKGIDGFVCGNRVLLEQRQSYQTILNELKK